jgi:hypothetical protein
MNPIIGDLLFFYPGNIYLTLIEDNEKYLVLKDICDWKYIFMKEDGILIPRDYLYSINEAIQSGVYSKSNYRICRL